MSFWTKFKSKSVNPELAKQLMDKTQQEIDKMPPINIIVAGKTGSGKSTLINALFRDKIAQTGVGLPVTQGIVKLTKAGIPLALYDTRGLELSERVQQTIQEDLLTLIQTSKGKDEREQIHLVYYCVSAASARIEPFEIALIETLAQHIPVIVVLTQAISPDNEQFKQYLCEMDWQVKEVIPVLAKDFELLRGQTITSFGLQALVDKTFEHVPSQVHQAFINAQQIDLKRKIETARGWAKTYVSSAFGIGFIPIPVADATLLIPMQITMLAHLTAIFGVSLDKAQVLSLLAGIGGTSGTTLLGKWVVGNIFKWFPGLGSVAGGVVSGTSAGVLTLALAYSYIEVLHQLTKAERLGREIPLFQLQNLMQRNLDTHLKEVLQYVPENIREHIVPKWLNR